MPKTFGLSTEAYKCFIIAGALFVASPSVAESLNDPTRPPTVETSGVADTGQQVDAGPVLQAVTLSKLRRVATISGEEVPLGGKYGDARLIRLTDSTAVLRNPDGTLQTLHMYSRVEKKVLTPSAGKRKKQADQK